MDNSWQLVAVIVGISGQWAGAWLQRSREAREDKLREGTLEEHGQMIQILQGRIEDLHDRLLTLEQPVEFPPERGGHGGPAGAQQPQDPKKRGHSED